MRVAELSGALLDEWVGRAEGIPADSPLRKMAVAIGSIATYYPPYSTSWEDGGPIIQRERIGIEPSGDKWDAYFNAYHSSDGMEANPYYAFAYDAPTPLIAAMRCYVIAKFGETVPDQPEN